MAKPSIMCSYKGLGWHTEASLPKLPGYPRFGSSKKSLRPIHQLRPFLWIAAKQAVFPLSKAGKRSGEGKRESTTVLLEPMPMVDKDLQAVHQGGCLKIGRTPYKAMAEEKSIGN